jgi:hypothetical protein
MVPEDSPGFDRAASPPHQSPYSTGVQQRSRPRTPPASSRRTGDLPQRPRRRGLASRRVAAHSGHPRAWAVRSAAAPQGPGCPLRRLTLPGLQPAWELLSLPGHADSEIYLGGALGDDHTGLTADLQPELHLGFVRCHLAEQVHNLLQ